MAFSSSSLGKTISNGTQSPTGATATAERSFCYPERANAASGTKQASFESYAIFQSEQQNDASAKSDPSGGGEGVMGASIGPMGAYATLGTDGSGLQRRIVEILAATGAYKGKEDAGAQMFDAAAASAAFAMDVLEEHGKKHDYDPIEDVQVLYLM